MQLSAHQLSLLLDEVTAMSRTKRSFVEGLTRLDCPSLGRIGRAACSLSKRLQAGQAPETAFATVAGPYGQQVSAALASLQSTGSTEPITRLAQMLRRQSELKTAFRVAMVYPLVTTLIAYLIVSLGITNLIIGHWATQINDGQQANVWLGPCLWLRANFWWPPLILLVGYLVYRILLRQGWLSRSLESKFSQHISWSMYCDMLAVQMNSGATLSESLPIAAQATGTSTLSTDSPPMVAWLLQRAHTVPVSETTDQLHSLAEWYREDAMRRGRFWVQWFPSIVSVCGTVAAFVIYWGLVLKPLYDGFVQVAQ